MNVGVSVVWREEISKIMLKYYKIIVNGIEFKTGGGFIHSRNSLATLEIEDNKGYLDYIVD